MKPQPAPPQIYPIEYPHLMPGSPDMPSRARNKNPIIPPARIISQMGHALSRAMKTSSCRCGCPPNRRISANLQERSIFFRAG